MGRNTLIVLLILIFGGTIFTLHWIYDERPNDPEIARLDELEKREGLVCYNRAAGLPYKQIPDAEYRELLSLAKRHGRTVLTLDVLKEGSLKAKGQ